MDERKKQILKAIIDDFISTAEPVGSRTIAKKNPLGISPATIRNEMADLEDMGYLEQPHTSAGRVPSVQGYRLYVDQLMRKDELSMEDMQYIKTHLELKINELVDLIKQASSVLSTITQYTSIASAPKMRRCIIKSIQLMYLEPKKVLLVLLTNEGLIRHSLITVTKAVNQSEIEKISAVLDAKLAGLAIEQLNMPLIQEIQREMELPDEFVFAIFSNISDSIANIENNEVFLDGAANMLNHHEFHDMEKARDFFNLMQKKEIIGGLLSADESDQNPNVVQVKIGDEIQLDQVRDFSVVTTSYSVGEYVIGSIGIIGPKRMAYPRVISAMDHIRSKLNDELRKMIDGG